MVEQRVLEGVGAVVENMNNQDSLPSRRHPAHHAVLTTGNISPIVFLTVCARDRKDIFASSDVQQLLVCSWRQAIHWSVGRYIIMPNHIHLFCAPASYPPESMRSWIKYWKTLVSRSWPRPGEQPIWQQDVWDTQLRREDNYAAKWEYVRQNPVRAGLAVRPEDWPYQGELVVLSWHDR